MCIIACDFDNTIAYRSENDIPEKLLPNAKEVINWLYDNGHTIIIWTCRSGEKLQQAIDFLNLNGIKYHKVNENIDTLDFETSNKIFADEYIDDRNYKTKIDWIEIKMHFLGLQMKNIVDEAVKTVQMTRLAKKIIAQRGMPENVQQIYDGPDSHHRYDQIGIMGPNRDWLDDTAIAEELENNEYQRAVPEVVSSEEEESPRRDNLQRYRDNDDMPRRKIYLDQKSDRPMAL